MKNDIIENLKKESFCSFHYFGKFKIKKIVTKINLNMFFLERENSQPIKNKIV